MCALAGHTELHVAVEGRRHRARGLLCSMDISPQQMIRNLAKVYGRDSSSHDVSGWLTLCGLNHLTSLFGDIGVSEVRDFWLVDRHDLEEADLSQEQIAAFERHRASFDNVESLWADPASARTKAQSPRNTSDSTAQLQYRSPDRNAAADSLVQDIKQLLHELHQKKTMLQSTDDVVTDAAAVDEAIATAMREAHSALLEQKWAREVEEDEDRIEELRIHRVCFPLVCCRVPFVASQRA